VPDLTRALRNLAGASVKQAPGIPQNTEATNKALTLAMAVQLLNFCLLGDLSLRHRLRPLPLLLNCLVQAALNKEMQVKL
jgi:hypothetical protein